MSKRGLGKGLGALILASSPEDNELTSEIEINQIVPNKCQPRRDFDEQALAELAQSIKQYGVIQPIVVRKTFTGYELVAGERRWRAAQLVGLKAIPAVVREYTDAEMMEIALIENIQRQDLNAIEEAQAYRRLMDEFGLTQEEVSIKIGRSRSHIANFVRLLNLHSAVRDYVSRGTLSMGQARPLLALEDKNAQLELAKIIVEQDLSARDAEELAKRGMKSPQPKKIKNKVKTELFLAEAEDQLKMIFGTQVKIRPGKVKGKIEIEFYSNEDLERIIEVVTEKIPLAAATMRKPLVV